MHIKFQIVEVNFLLIWFSISKIIYKKNFWNIVFKSFEFISYNFSFEWIQLFFEWINSFYVNPFQLQKYTSLITRRYILLFEVIVKCNSDYQIQKSLIWIL